MLGQPALPLRQSKFYIVYIREAHPTDGRQSRANAQEKILVKQPKTVEERIDIAAQMCSKLEISIPTLIDGIDNKVGNAYSGMPDRLYLVGRDGKIAFKGDRGPAGFKPSELGAAIEAELGGKALAQGGDRPPERRGGRDASLRGLADQL